MKLLGLTLRHAKPYWPWITAVLILQLISTIAALYLPTLNAQIIDKGISVGDTDFIWSTGMTMIVVCFVQVAAAIGGIYFGARTAMAIGRDLRREVYYRVNALGALDVSRFGTATLITRNTNDVQQVQMLVLMALNFMVSTPIMCIGGIFMAVREDVGLSWLVWVSVPLLFAVVGFLVVKLLPLFREMQERIDTVNAVVREQIVGIRVIRAFVREKFEAERYRDANLNLTRVSVRVGNLFVLMFPLIMMILHLATAAVLWFGGHRISSGQMQIGSLTAFLQYLLQILVAVMMGVFMVMMIPRAAISAERLDDVLSAVPSLAVPQGTAPPVGHAVEFSAVSFGYPGAERPVLNNVTFTAREGQTTAIVGSTGSGKSTLLNLIPLLFDPQGGTVRIGGVDVSELSRRQMADLVGLVPQKPYLFSGTVASNLKFGRPDADDDELWEALRVAQAKDFVEGKPKQLGAPIAQGGTNVSGGQRQRLCIARALAAQPRIFLFDDSFSALDVTTDQRLCASLSEATTGATVIIVAQRISTIREADHIIVLDNGEIVGAGTHEQLLDDNDTYREIVASQLSIEGAS
ncbi:ABC transporter ATP-binding protein [Arthrobacter sp. LAPM80]|uniref:ABC transporter ATP-binding protein n=1 Tax=Arthrobacter sp. LAPM80 TaxID=3141788 RepID=UPI00398B0E2E